MVAQRTADVLQRGYWGYNSRWALRVLPHALEGTAPALVTILLGSNDAVMPDLGKSTPHLLCSHTLSLPPAPAEPTACKRKAVNREAGLGGDTRKRKLTRHVGRRRHPLNPSGPGVQRRRTGARRLWLGAKSPEWLLGMLDSGWSVDQVVFLVCCAVVPFSFSRSARTQLTESAESSYETRGAEPAYTRPGVI